LFERFEDTVTARFISRMHINDYRDSGQRKMWLLKVILTIDFCY